LPRLYDFACSLGATLIVANYSRYVIDVNRPPDGANLYPGRDTPKLCPTDTFDARPLYRGGAGPDAAEIARRLDAVWWPYHRRIEREIARVRDEHGIAVLWDAHSIVSVAPRLFEGRLTDFNLGTADGASCDPALAASLKRALEAHPRYTSVVDGRFKGGYITRRYGRPAENVHAVQLEMTQHTYMQEEPPYTFSSAQAADVRPILEAQLDLARDWAVNQAYRR
jgi:N-formylglutamate deformylase